MGLFRIFNIYFGKINVIGASLKAIMVFGIAVICGFDTEKNWENKK